MTTTHRTAAPRPRSYEMKKCKHVTVVHEWRTDENGDDRVIRKRCSPTAGCGALLPFREPANDAPIEVQIEIRAAMIADSGRVGWISLDERFGWDAHADGDTPLWTSESEATRAERLAGWLAREIATHDALDAALVSAAATHNALCDQLGAADARVTTDPTDSAPQDEPPTEPAP